MKITVAGVQKEVADGLTVAQLIVDEKVETPQYVTVTINDEFVENGTFESTVLKDGDTVPLFHGRWTVKWHSPMNRLNGTPVISF